MQQSNGESTAPRKVALITGAARRIGAKIAERLHRVGMDVVIHHNSSASEATALRDRLNAARPESAITVQANLISPDAPNLLIDTATEHFGRLDVLVNNASSFFPTPVGTIDEGVWDDLVGTNLKAPLFIAQAAAPWLKTSRGVIINLGDIHGQRPLANHPVYCAAKAGLLMVTQALARDLGPEIRVNAVSPGPILWPETGAVDESAQRAIVNSTALKRLGEPDDIASTVEFLATGAPYITGQILAVDGGRSLAG